MSSVEKSMEEFCKGLSEAELDQAEAIEKEVGDLLKQGLSEEVALRLVQTVMEIRAQLPSATVEGVLEVVFKQGIAVLRYLRREGKLGGELGGKTKAGKPKSQRRTVQGVRGV